MTIVTDPAVCTATQISSKDDPSWEPCPSHMMLPMLMKIREVRAELPIKTSVASETVAAGDAPDNLSVFEQGTLATTDHELISLISVVSPSEVPHTATLFEALRNAEHHPQLPIKVTWQQVDHADAECPRSPEYAGASQPQRTDSSPTDSSPSKPTRSCTMRCVSLCTVTLVSTRVRCFVFSFT